MGKSKVYGIRLNPDDEDEKRAMDIIEQHAAQGYDIKQIIVPALLRYAGLDPVKPEYLVLQTRQLLLSIDDLREVVQELKNSGGAFAPRAAESKPASGNEGNQVSEDDPMMQALMKRARAGKRTD